MRNRTWGVSILLLLAGCGRDFAVPDRPDDGQPLAALHARLEVVPGEEVETRVTGGMPPYAIASATAAGEPAEWARFSFDRGGSGGWANLYESGRLVYRAGEHGSTGAEDVRDTLQVRDAAGAEVEVDIRVGPALGLRASAQDVGPGGTVFLGATGGRPPYLFGLASAPSGGRVDPVTGRYEPGPRGCTVDRPVVIDAVGVQALAEIAVTCPALEGSPDRVHSAFVLEPDGGGIASPVFVAPGAGETRVVFPGLGGVQRTFGVPGEIVAATAARGPGKVVVAADVSPFSWAPEVRVWAVSPLSGAQELISIASGVYPIPTRAVTLVAAPGLETDWSGGVQVGWTGTDGIRYSTRVDAASQSVGVAPEAAPVPTAAATFDVSLPSPDPRGARVVHLAVPAPGATRWTWYWGELSSPFGGLALGGQVDVDPELAQSEILEVVGARGDGLTQDARIVVRARGPAGEALWVLDNRITPGNALETWTVLTRPPVRLEGDPRALAAAELDGLPGDEILAVDGAGALQVLVEDLLGGYQAEPISWRLPAGTERLLSVDLDGDARGDLIATGPGPAILAMPRGVPTLGSPAAAYGLGGLHDASVLGCLAREEDAAIVALDPGRDATGATAAGLGGSGGAVLVPGGGLLGTGDPVVIGAAGERVSAVTAARLQPAGAWPDPVDLVAAVEPSPGAPAELRWIESLRPGRAEPYRSILDAAGDPATFPGLSWMQPLADKTAGVEAVLLAGVGLAAVQVGADGVARIGETVEVAPLVVSAPLRQPRSGIRPPDRHLVMAREQLSELSFLYEIRIEDGAVAVAELVEFWLFEDAALAALPWPEGVGVRVVETTETGLTVHYPGGRDSCPIPLGFAPDVLEVAWTDGTAPTAGAPGALSLFAGSSQTGRVVHLGASAEAAGIRVLYDTSVGPFAAASAVGPILGDDALPDLLLGRDPLIVLPAAAQGFVASGERFCE